MKKPKQKTSGEGFDIYQGDCLDIIPQLIAEGVEVDAVITDPPYGINVDKNNPFSYGTKGAKKSNPVNWDDSLPLEWLQCAFDILRPGGNFLSFCDSRTSSDFWRAVDKVGKPQRLFYYMKTNPMPQPHPRYASAVEVAVMARKEGSAGFFSGGGACPNYWMGGLAMGKDRTEHPTQKNLKLMRKLVRDLVPEGGTVLDPFGGSGTTAVAAMLEGRRAVCIERDPEYFKIMQWRLADWSDSDEMRQYDFGFDVRQ
jgi:DNA modification methylase